MTKADKIVHRVLLTNDDGIDAPGIAILAKIAEQIADEVWIVAPAQDRSGVSNSLSLREPVRVVKRSERQFAVYGTPADCVGLALKELMKDSLPDLLLSGVNRGSNIGFETILSGTVGAATTGMLLGVPSIAMSQCFTDGQELPWQTALQHGPDAIRKLVGIGWSADICLNINYPDCAAESVRGLKVTSQGIGHVGGINVSDCVDPQGDVYHWIRVDNIEQENLPDSEAVAVANRFISVTPLTYERTDLQAKQTLAKQFAG